MLVSSKHEIVGIGSRRVDGRESKVMCYACDTGMWEWKAEVVYMLTRRTDVYSPTPDCRMRQRREVKCEHESTNFPFPDLKLKVTNDAFPKPSQAYKALLLNKTSKTRRTARDTVAICGVPRTHQR